MEKEFVPYELAVRLKELEFDEPCLGFYKKYKGREGELVLLKDNKHKDYFWRNIVVVFNNQEEVEPNYKEKVSPEYDTHCLAPLWQQAFMFIQSKIDLYEQGLELTLTSKDWILTDGTYYKSKNEKALMRLIILVEDEK